MPDGGGKRGPAGGFEDQREVALHFIDAYDDFVRAAQMAAALSPADHGSDARPGPSGDLCCEMPDAAGGAGNKHTLAEQRRAVAECAQRRQPGDRQGGGFLEEDIVRQDRHSVRRYGDTLSPPGIVGQRDDARAGLRAAAVGRWSNDYTADILARPPALGTDLKQPQ